MATSAASTTDSVRWILVFFHSGEEEESERDDFPEVDFWQDNKETAISEAKRVLGELRAREDQRDWKAAGHPDPFAVAEGRHPIQQWILTFDDLDGLD